jgi:hypothetical protein
MAYSSISIIFELRRRFRSFPPDIGETIVIGLAYHDCGSANIDQHIVYVAQLEDGSNVTYTPAEFANKFNWKNDPSKARFLKLDDEK